MLFCAQVGNLNVDSIDLVTNGMQKSLIGMQHIIMTLCHSARANSCCHVVRLNGLVL
jgi:hypothetical protein